MSAVSAAPLAPTPPQAGVYIGPDALTGEAFAFDPWALYAAGELTNPNMLLAGVIAPLPCERGPSR